MKSRNLAHRSREQKRSLFLEQVGLRRHRTGRRLKFETLEPRIVLASRFVDNPGDFIITSDQGAVGLDDGDTVTWNPGAGSAHGGAVAGLVFGADAFGSIQDAIDAAAATDAILVAEGTFAEQVVINKQINLLGNQVGVDARNRVAAESIITFGSGILVELQTGVAGTTIDGFTLGGGARGIESTTGPIDNLSILNNRILGFTNAGIFLNDTGVDITISQNVIDGSSKTGGGGLVHLDNDNFDGLVFTNNWVVNGVTGTGFFVDGNHNVGVSATRAPLIQGNLISNNGTGMNLGRFAFEFGTISENTFSNNLFDGLQGGIQNSLITRNTFSNNGRSGLALTGFGGAGDATRGAQNNQIIENFFVGNAVEDVFLSSGQFPGTISTNVINFNSLTSTTGLTYAGTETINAELNWWGSPTGPTYFLNPGGAGAILNNPAGTVDFSPFLSNGTDTQPGTLGFQPNLTPTGITVIGTADDDVLIITAASANSGTWQLISGGVAGPVITFSDITSFAFTADGGNDTLRIINSTALFAPVNGVFYDGGTQGGAPGDLLEILGGVAGNLTFNYNPRTADGNNGSVILVSGPTIAAYSYTGLEPILVDLDASPTVAVFNLPDDGLDNLAILEDDGNLANGLVQLRSGNATFETTVFTNPTFGARINASDDGETVTLARLDDGFTAFVDYFGNAGNDTFVLDFSSGVNVVPTVGPNQVAFLGGGGTDRLNLLTGYSATNIDYTFGDIQGIDLGPQAGTVSIDGRGVSYQDLEGPVGDDLVSTNRSFTFDPGLVGNKVISLGDDPTPSNGVSRLSSNAGTPTVNFRDPATLLTLNAGVGNDTINLSPLDAQAVNPASVQVNGEGGNDTFNIGGTNVPTNLSGGADNDSFVFSNGATLSGGTIDGGAGNNTLDYSAYATAVAANLGLGTTGLTGTIQGEQEVPPKTTAAAGTVTVGNYDPIAKTFDISVSVTDLDPAIVTGFHIHRAPFGVNGPIIVDLTPLAPLVPVGTGFTFTATGVSLAASLLGGVVNEASFLGGATYVNIHTPTNPGGEIRGQLFSTGNVNLASGTATGTGGITNIQNVTGGSAGDGLIGSFASNVLTGNAGSDTLLGGPGADTMNGDAGNDVLLWSNGDGTDVINGGADADIVQVNGSLGGATIDDSFTIGAGPGGRVDFDRVSAGPFSLDIGTTETLTVNGISGNDTFTVGSLAGVISLTTINLNGLAGNDTFHVTPAATVTINVNGFEPHFPTLPGDTLNYVGPGTVTPTGIGSGVISRAGVQNVNFISIEELTGGPFAVVTPGAIDVFNNKTDPSIVTIATASGQVSFDATSLLTLTPGNGVVNLIGDNNDTIDQTDNFVVVGTGPNAFDLFINGSPAVAFTGVLFLNVFGHDLVDTLELTAYADNAGGPAGNQPRGWGIQVTYDEGLPDGTDGDQADLLIYNTVAANPVSEDIVVQPSGPEDGELRVTNAVDGSVIVVVSYVNNLDIVVDDNDGFESDSDMLTLRGTDPDTVAASGRDTFVADFTAAGDAANPLVTVSDTASATVLYRLQDFSGFGSITLQSLAGTDTLSVTNRAGLTVHVDGGDPVSGDVLNVAVPGNARFTQGADATTGLIDSSGVGDINIVGVELVNISSDAAASTFTARGTHDNDTFAAATLGGANRIWINDGSVISFANFSGLTLQGLFGSDAFSITPMEGVAVTVQGGDPTASDTVVVNGTTGTDTIIFSPTAADGGTMQVNALGLVTLQTVEHLTISGLDGADAMIINGTALDDSTVVNPTGTGDGTFTSDASPPLTFLSISAVTVSGGGGGFDSVTINGTAGPDTVTSTATSITLGGTVTLGAGIDQLNLNTFGGNDSIILSLAVPGLAKVIDAGAGNDIVSLAGVAVDPADPTIDGGDGDDLLIGSPNADSIFGGAGNDTINGGGGNDQLYGEEGNDVLNGGDGDDVIFGGAGSDTITGGLGIDAQFGGDDSDRFLWNEGDGGNNAETIEGGTGQDQFIFNGATAAQMAVENFTLSASVSPRISFSRAAGSHSLAKVEYIEINGNSGDETYSIFDLSGTDLTYLSIRAGAAGDSEIVGILGRNVSDEVDVRRHPVLLGIQVTGLSYTVDVLGTSAADNDQFAVNTQAGNDTVVALDDFSALVDPARFSIFAGAGDDFVAAYGQIFGGDGDDTLVGNDSAQTIRGGNGNDTIRGGGGADLLFGEAGEDIFLLDFDAASDTFDGGDDFDTILFAGTSAGDILSANQTAAGTLVTTRNGATETDTLFLQLGTRTVERVRIEAGSGDDIILVTQLDALGVDERTNGVLFDVDGGSAATRDRLSVQDNGTGDLVLYRKGESDSAGSISVGPGNAESLETVFANVEFIQPLAAAGGQVLVFKHDPNEFNDDRVNATHLGAGETINLDPTIDPGPFTAVPAGFAPLPGDEDWYRVVAEKTGTLDFQVYFTMITTVLSGRPGLPSGGDLDIELYDATGDLIVSGAGAFGLNDADDNERIRIPAVQGQVYYLRVFGAGDAINNYSVTVINDGGPTPYGLELDDQPPVDGVNSDTGRSQFDNITRDNTPTLVLRLDDGFFLNDLPGNATPDSPPDEVIPIPFQVGPVGAGYAIAVFDEGPNPNPGVGAPQVPLGFATQTSPGVYQFTTPALVDGSHFLSARVQIIDPAAPQQTGFTARSALLEIIVDTLPPPVSLGQPGILDDGVISDSDTGVAPPNPDTIIDRVTFDATPTFWGRAEADAIVRVYADVNGNGTLEVGIDAFLGQDTAIPLDGTNQEPDGFWKIESVVSLNDPDFFPVPDGLRTIFVTAEDVAGNVNAAGAGAADTLRIFVDTRGPRVTDVDINSAGNPYDLFDPKPSTDGPTPLVNSLVISFSDPPNRLAPDFLLPALKADVAANPGHYLLVGDFSGVIPIAQVIVTNLPVVSGQPALATVQLVFVDPLPDDRFTLTISDSISDPVGNRLDGETNTIQPLENPLFPSGDGIPGGNFVARFTVDTRPEVGTWGAGSAWIDTNGNTSFDPNNPDFTNRDITYILGLTGDDLFAGNFALGAGDVADGFDKLAAYGRVNGVWRWLVDTDNDGVPNVNQIDPAGINGLPVAGNFDGNAANGDEVGLFTGTTWWFDTNHDFQVDFSIAAGAGFIGYPVVGDFDGDGFDDLGAWADDTFKFNLSSAGATLNANLPGLNGAVEATFRFGFPGVNERPVAADMNQDGFADIGLFVPNRAGVSPDESAEWYIVVSGLVQNNDNNGPNPLGPSILDRIVTDPITGQNVVRFTPVPFGNDLYIQYGDEFGLPILGNFDPPATSSGGSNPGTNTRDPLDVNNDGRVSPFDALLIVNHLNQHGGATMVQQAAFPQAPYLDVTNDSRISPMDALAVINHLNRKASDQLLAAEGEADEFFSALGRSGSGSQEGESEILAILADDVETQRRRRG